jgi:hypothetical protein
MKPTYTIIHDHMAHVDSVCSLCADGKFRSGVSYGFGKSSTLIYKRLSAAEKRLRKVNKRLFPNARITMH